MIDSLRGERDRLQARIDEIEVAAAGGGDEARVARPRMAAAPRPAQAEPGAAAGGSAARSRSAAKSRCLIS
jgi:hypothetical protein